MEDHAAFKAELIGRVQAGLRTEGIDENELGAVVEKCVKLVMGE